MIENIKLKKFPQIFEEISFIYKETFSSPPFSSDVSDKNIGMFFREHLNHGSIYVSKNFIGMIVGFITYIPLKFFSDYNIIDLEEFPLKKSIYISAIVIEKNNKYKGYGKKLFNFVLNNNKDKNIVVRTRNDTPEIHSLLKSNGFIIIKEYEQNINGKILSLYIWGLNQI